MSGGAGGRRGSGWGWFASKGLGTGVPGDCGFAVEAAAPDAEPEDAADADWRRPAALEPFCLGVALVATTRTGDAWTLLLPAETFEGLPTFTLTADCSSCASFASACAWSFEDTGSSCSLKLGKPGDFPDSIAEFLRTRESWELETLLPGV